MDTTTTLAQPADVPAAPSLAARTDNRALLLIALFKLAKALLFLAAAFGTLRMINKDTEVEAKKILHVFRMHDDGKIARAILVKANVIDNPHKRIIGAVLAFYGLLFSIEGFGLLARQRWAEYFTVIMTATGIPIELYELLHRPNHAKVVELVPEEQRHLLIFDKFFLLKLAALGLNVAILWFLIHYVRHNNPHKLAERKDAPPLGEEGSKATV